jgi:hypothetical protein
MVFGAECSACKRWNPVSPMQIDLEFRRCRSDGLVAVTPTAGIAAQRATSAVPIIFILCPIPFAQSWLVAWRVRVPISRAYRIRRDGTYLIHGDRGYAKAAAGAAKSLVQIG